MSSRDSLTNTIKSQALFIDDLSRARLAELISVRYYSTAQLPAYSQSGHLSHALNMQNMPEAFQAVKLYLTKHLNKGTLSAAIKAF